MFCSKCGKKLGDKAKFCVECGHPTAGTGSSNLRKERVPLTKKQKLISAISGVFVLFVILLLIIGKSFSSPQRMVDEFDRLLSEKDTQGLVDLMDSESKSMAISNETVKPMVDYFSKNKDEKEQLIENLTDQASSFQKKGENSFSNAAVNLKKQGRSWLIFKKYRLVAKIHTIKISGLNRENVADLLLSGESLSKDLTSGKAFVGLHDLVGNVTMPFGQRLDVKEKVEVPFIEADEVTFYLDFNQKLIKNKSLQNSLVDTVAEFNKEYTESLLSKEYSNISRSTLQLRSFLSSEEYPISLFDTNSPSFVGIQYVQTQVDKSTFQLDLMETPTVRLIGTLSYEMGYKKSLDEEYTKDKDMSTRLYEYLLVYDKKQGKWLVDSLDYSYDMELITYDEGTNQLIGDEIVTVPALEEKFIEGGFSILLTESDSDNLVSQYIRSLCNAINYKDSTYFEGLVLMGSDLDHLNQNLIKSLDEKYVTQSIVDYQVIHFEQEGNQATISTREMYSILNGGTVETKTFHYTYTLACIADESGSAKWMFTDIE